jgi:hypothetical protein
MIEPDVLSFNLDHPLLDGFSEERPDGRVIMVAPDEVNLLAPDAVAVRDGLLEPSFAEIPNDPECVVDRDA